MGRIKQKEIKENWEEEKEELYNWCFKKCGEECEEAIKKEKEKDRQRFIEILEKLKERWLSFSGVWTKESEPFQTGFNSAVKQTNQKIQEVIETLKDEK